MKEYTARKHPRLKGYDYSSNGSYFITFCVKDKQKLLGKVAGYDASSIPFMLLSEYGEIIHKEIEKTYLYYNDILVDNFVVMPNHVHMIITIQKEDSVQRELDGAGGVAPYNGDCDNSKNCGNIEKKNEYDIWL
jgi:REP element-mobilizing transposase RayT